MAFLDVALAPGNVLGVLGIHQIDFQTMLFEHLKRNSASTRVAAALRMAVLSLRHSETALGAYYRRTAQRAGGDIAVFATARKLATLIPPAPMGATLRGRRRGGI